MEKIGTIGTLDLYLPEAKPLALDLCLIDFLIGWGRQNDAGPLQTVHQAIAILEVLKRDLAHDDCVTAKDWDLVEYHHLLILKLMEDRANGLEPSDEWHAMDATASVEG